MMMKVMIIVQNMKIINNRRDNTDDNDDDSCSNDDSGDDKDDDKDDDDDDYTDDYVDYGCGVDVDRFPKIQFPFFEALK